MSRNLNLLRCLSWFLPQSLLLLFFFSSLNLTFSLSLTTVTLSGQGAPSPRLPGWRPSLTMPATLSFINVEGSPYWLLVGSLGLSTLASRRKSHLALTMFNCMSSKSPLYLSQLFPLPSSHYNTCSALSSQLNLPPNRSSFGQKSFSFMGTALWQSLPPNIRDTKEFNSFYSLCQQHFSTNI